MTGALTAAVIGAAGAVTGAAVGAASGWWTATLTARHAERTRRAERRESAYAEFLTSSEALHRIITASETMLATKPGDTIGGHVAQATGSVSRAYIAVLIAGSPEAASTGADIDGKARDIHRWFTSTVSGIPLTPQADGELGSHLSEYTALLGKFAETARRELG